MSNKYLIFGATGSIGSSLAEQLTNSDHEVHLIARNKDELKPLSEKLGCTYSVADVSEENFIDKVKSDTSDFDVKGVAYCVGSIDLKPLKRVS